MRLRRKYFIMQSRRRRKMKHLLRGMAVAVIAIALMACPKHDGPYTARVDWKSHNTDYSIKVTNNTGERLIAFKGDLTEKTLIGGIPAHADNHGLPMNLSLFDKTEAFPMILLTETQYNTNKNSLQSLRNSPFTRVFVFFNKSGDNTAVYEIAAGLGGNNTLSILNNSGSINVEIRLGGTAGETLGYAPAGILESKFKLADGNYTVFPVFKSYNAVRDVVTTVYPKRAGGGAWRQTLSFGEGITESEINLSKVLEQTTITLGAAWVYVNNQTTSGGIRFVQGSQVQKTATGLTNIMTNRTFQIDMPQAGNGDYAESLEVANWKFGPDGDEVELQKSKDDKTKVTTLIIGQNKMYTVTVTGNANAGTIEAYISETTDIPANQL
jgi:hypothetical protein